MASGVVSAAMKSIISSYDLLLNAQLFKHTPKTHHRRRSGERSPCLASVVVTSSVCQPILTSS
jgi:hypothetical protein